MSLIAQLADILAESRAEYEEIMHGSGRNGGSGEAACGSDFRVDAVFGGEADDWTCGSNFADLAGSAAQFCGNVLAAGDNTVFMRYLMQKKNMTGKVQLIYIDPPFFSKANYGADIKLSSEKLGNMPTLKQIAYTDSWQEGTSEYLKMLCIRFYMMRDLLADEGCLWVHLDWHIVHYVKVLLDEIFGQKNFINEIIWNYKSGGSSKRHYARKHDTLLFYAKSPKYYFEAQKEKSYNRGYKPYRFKGVREYRDETGWYTMVNMKDVWQIDMVGRTSAERTGYATQKPEALLTRILESCTREGDIVCDFFGGSGTLAAAADKMRRKWIYCDLGGLAAASANKRLAKSGSSFSVLVQENVCKEEGVIRHETGETQDGRRICKVRSEADCKAEADYEIRCGAVCGTCDIYVRSEIADAGVLGSMHTYGSADTLAETEEQGAENAFASLDTLENCLLTIELTSYCVNKNSQIPVNEKNLEILRGAMNKDPLRFIDFWSVDYAYDGKVHRADDIFCRDKGQLQLKAEHILRRHRQQKDAVCGAEHLISVRACDIFGNMAEQILKI